jgi:hypothetical protein
MAAKSYMATVWRATEASSTKSAFQNLVRQAQCKREAQDIQQRFLHFGSSFVSLRHSSGVLKCTLSSEPVSGIGPASGQDCEAFCADRVLKGPALEQQGESSLDKGCMETT